MDDLVVLVTGVGAPGSIGTLHSLKNNFDKRKIKIIGTDIDENAVGKYIYDSFYKIERPDHSTYLEQLYEICQHEKVQVIVPQNTAELQILSANKSYFERIGTKIAVAKSESIILANDKFRLLEIARKSGIPAPEFYLVATKEDLIEFSKLLGWPEHRVVVKPPISSGMRGFRIIDENYKSKDAFYNEKPTNTVTNMDLLIKILGETFHPLVLMEYVPGKEYTVDLLRTKENIVVVPRTRDQIRLGITFRGTLEENRLIIEYSKILSEALDMEYAYGFQFKLNESGLPLILECNPRVQGSMVLSTFSGANIIYGAVKYAMQEPVPPFEIKWGTRLIRYWGGLILSEDKIIGKI